MFRVHAVHVYLGVGLGVVRGLCKKFEGDVYLTSRYVIGVYINTKKTTFYFNFYTSFKHKRHVLKEKLSYDQFLLVYL